MKLDMVGRMPSELLGVQRDILERLSGNDGDVWLERYKRLHAGENPFAELTGGSASVDAWKDELVRATRKKLAKFSRAWARQVTAVPDSWPPEFLANAAAYNLRPVFLPNEDIGETFRCPRYVKPEDWYYQKLRTRDVKGERPARLRAGWYLVDFSAGADYTDGTQVFPNDPWAPLITELRDKDIGKHPDTPSGSRFSITWDEWNDCVLAHMAAKLQVTRAQTRLERASEFNFIGNVYDTARDRFNCWMWLQDQYEDAYRLIGGSRDSGGLASVNYGWHGCRNDSVAARPLVRFMQ